MRSVSIGPGEIQFTLTLKSAVSLANEREKPSTPAFDASSTSLCAVLKLPS